MKSEGLGENKGAIIMSCFVVWIDRTHAKVFQISREKIEPKALKSHFQDHHTHRLNSMDLRQREKKLFQEVVELLSTESQILILGPGVVKHHFQNYLNEHYPLLAKRVVGCETVDHLTDPQIAAQALKYFNVGPCP